MEKQKKGSNSRASVVKGQNMASPGEKSKKKVKGRRGELNRWESQPPKLRGRRHFRQDSRDSVEEDEGATGKKALSESVKADIMMETSSVVDEKLLRFLEDDSSTINLEALPKKLSLSTSSGGIAASDYQPVSRPDDAARIVPAKETSSWGRHHAQHKTGKPMGRPGSVGGAASSTGTKLRLEAGSGYSKNALSRRSLRSTSKTKHFRRKAITATNSKNEKAKPMLQLEWLAFRFLMTNTKY